MSLIKSVLLLLTFLLIYEQNKVSTLHARHYHAARRFEGAFEGFLRSWLDVLSMHSPKKVKKYVKILGDELSDIRYSSAERLARHVRKLAKKDSQYIQEKIKTYKRELDRNPPERQKFFSLINQAFNAQQASQFEDYIHHLKDWFYEYRLTIQGETRKLIREVIIENIKKKLSTRDQIKLKKALKKACKEYDHTTDDDGNWTEEFPLKMELIEELLKKNISEDLVINWKV